MKLLAKIVAVALACLFLLCIAVGILFFSTASVSSSAVSTLSTGRTVTAISDGWSGVGTSSTKDTTTINLAGHKIVVSPTLVTVDGQRYATIDPNAKAIVVTSHKGELAFEADGAAVAPAATESAAD